MGEKILLHIIYLNTQLLKLYKFVGKLFTVQNFNLIRG